MARALIDRYVTPITDSITDKLVSLQTGDMALLLPTERLDRLAQLYQERLAAAQENPEDVSSLLQIVDPYLSAARDVYKSGTGYREIFASIEADLADLGRSVLDWAESQTVDYGAISSAVASGVRDEINRLRDAIEGMEVHVTITTTMDNEVVAQKTARILRYAQGNDYVRNW